MKVYTYSKARQRLASLLDEAREGGEVRSPLDVAGVDTKVSREDILQAIRESRAREPRGT